MFICDFKCPCMWTSTFQCLHVCYASFMRYVELWAFVCVCVFFDVCLVLVPLLINFSSAIHFTLFAISNGTFTTMCLIIRNLFASFSIIRTYWPISPSYSPSHCTISTFPSNSVDVCVYVNVYLIWWRFFSLFFLFLTHFRYFNRFRLSRSFFHFFIRFRLRCVESYACTILLRMFSLSLSLFLFITTLQIQKWNGWCPLSCRITMKRTYQNVCTFVQWTAAESTCVYVKTNIRLPLD